MLLKPQTHSFFFWWTINNMRLFLTDTTTTTTRRRDESLYILNGSMLPIFCPFRVTSCFICRKPRQNQHQIKINTKNSIDINNNLSNQRPCPVPTFSSRSKRDCIWDLRLYICVGFLLLFAVLFHYLLCFSISGPQWSSNSIHLHHRETEPKSSLKMLSVLPFCCMRSLTSIVHRNKLA